jgi:hypothetical protein
VSSFLMMHDRAYGEATYTHEFLSHMLGANRKSVTLAARSLQTAGLISYRRGRIQILDRAGLERASCECYAGTAFGLLAVDTLPTAMRSTVESALWSAPPLSLSVLPGDHAGCQETSRTRLAQAVGPAGAIGKSLS